MVALTPRPLLLLLSLGLRVPLWPILARGKKRLREETPGSWGAAARLEAVCGRKPQQDGRLPRGRRLLLLGPAADPVHYQNYPQL